MRNIWKAARDFGVDTFALSERLLLQMMYAHVFVGEQVKIFRDYVSGGGQSDVIMAFLVRRAYDYFVDGKVTDGFIAQQLEKMVERQEEPDVVCRLAYAKYFAENTAEIDDGVKVILNRILADLAERGIYFAFFLNFIGILPVAGQFLDKTIIEYHTRPGNRTVIHYLIEREPVGKGEYTKAEMTEMYAGIFCKQFVLFFGERLLYYIADEEDGKDTFTESANISKGELVGEHMDCRFSHINDIEMARTMMDYETVDRLLYDYYRQELVVEQMFSLELE
jgi:hypothetical protein